MAAAAANVCETALDQDEYVKRLAPKAPVTSQHFVSPHSLQAVEAVHIPNVPQALEAVDADHLHGMPEYESHDYIFRAVLFFDFDNDGIINPWEIFRGAHHGAQYLP